MKTSRCSNIGPELRFSACTTIASFIFGSILGYVASLVLKENPKQWKNLLKWGYSSLDDDNSSANENSSKENSLQSKNEIKQVESLDSKGVMILDGEEEPDIMSSSVKQKKQEKKDNIVIAVQRCRSASLLIENSSEEKSPSIVQFGISRSLTTTPDSVPSSCPGGIIIYISFSKHADETILYNAAKIVLNLPLLTEGVWGDGSETLSVLQIAARLVSKTEKKGITIMVIPQANLICKVKNMGKSIQYHNQISKEEGKRLYNQFLHCLELVSLEHQIITLSVGKSRNVLLPYPLLNEINKATGKSTQESKKLDASVPPKEMFLNHSLYSSWDDTGFPLTNVDGTPIQGKSTVKKLKKLYQTQQKRHSKFLSPSQTKDIVTTSGNAQEEMPVLSTNFIRIISGSFGKRQGLEFSSDMGPFCHILNL